MSDARDRQYWYSEEIENWAELEHYDELPSLWQRVTRKVNHYRVEFKHSNVIGSRVAESGVSRLERRHKPLIDLDYAHQYVASSTKGHAHLYLNVEISHWRWVILMIGLWVGKVISAGFLAHALYRGQSFVRQPWVHK